VPCVGAQAPNLDSVPPILLMSILVEPDHWWGTVARHDGKWRAPASTP